METAITEKDEYEVMERRLRARNLHRPKNKNAKSMDILDGSGVIHWYDNCPDIKGGYSLFPAEEFMKYSLCYEREICELCSSKNMEDLTTMMVASISNIACFVMFDLKSPHFKSLWVESPSGKYYELPFYTALRVARKRKDWFLAEVKPAPHNKDESVKERWWQRIKTWFHTTTPDK